MRVRKLYIQGEEKANFKVPRPTSPNVCTRCNRVYKHKSSLYKHLKWECGVESQFKCPICSYNCKQKINYFSHMNYKHKISREEVEAHIRNKTDRIVLTPDSRYSCSVCCKTYQAHSSLVRHIRHECRKPKRFQCIYCLQCFRQRYDIKKHVRSFHPERIEEFEVVFKQNDLKRTDIDEELILTRFMCGVCGKYYVQKSTLYRHMRYECGKKNQFKCPFCIKTARQKYDIKLHVYKMHSDRRIEFEPMNHSDLSPTLLRFAGILSLIMIFFLVSSSPKSMQPCGRKNGYLFFLFRTVRWPCLQCGKSYKWKTALQRHTKFECGKDPGFCCPLCDYKSYRKEHLKLHLLTRKHKSYVDMHNDMYGPA
ncbi:hypothetical protein NQ318_006119 [Aromia moschata]|uniref:C2H2-type domain-containing protein n=1 Tax=Aromia moschata TaxID=1265417 RepID=A0AAV8Z486_9CUCU|nr:hypothetical protein NQ318_006119 [Aromia moschata]